MRVLSNLTICSKMISALQLHHRGNDSHWSASSLELLRSNKLMVIQVLRTAEYHDWKYGRVSYLVRCFFAGGDFVPQRTLVWRLFGSLAQRRGVGVGVCPWQPVGRSQGCSWTSYRAQDGLWKQGLIWHKMSKYQRWGTLFLLNNHFLNLEYLALFYLFLIIEF